MKGGIWIPGMNAAKKTVATGLRLAGLTNNVPLFFDVNTGDLVIDVNFKLNGLKKIKGKTAIELKTAIDGFLKTPGEVIRGAGTNPSTTPKPSFIQRSLGMLGTQQQPQQQRGRQRTRRNRQDRRRTRRNRRS